MSEQTDIIGLIKKLKPQGLSNSEIARRIVEQDDSYSIGVLRKVVAVICKFEGIKFDINALPLVPVRQIVNKSGEVVSEVRSARMHAETATEGFELSKITKLSYGGENLTFVRNSNINTREVFDLLFEKYNSFKFPTFAKQKSIKGNRIAVLNIYDAHIDKIAIKSETGEDSSIDDNVKRYKTAFDSLLSDIIENDVSDIVFPIGNDFYHTNAINSKTKKGTYLEYYVNANEAYSIATDLIISSISKIAQYAKVHIPFIAGNHDKDKVNILGYWINKLFNSHKNITIDNSRRQRKYYEYGSNLFGFAHGDKEKRKINELPLMMLQDNIGTKSKFRKFYLGDLHHQFEYKFLKSKDLIGCEIEFLRAISCSDEYHDSHGWIGIPKSAYCDIFSKDSMSSYRIRKNF